MLRWGCTMIGLSLGIHAGTLPAQDVEPTPAAGIELTLEPDETVTSAETVWRPTASSPSSIAIEPAMPSTYQTFDRSALAVVPEPFARRVPPVASGGPSSWRWQTLPDGLFSRSYLAGPKEARLAGAWLYQTDENWVWDGTLGGRVGLVRFGTPGTDAEGWQLDLLGVATPRLDEDQELVSSDFRVGVPLTWSQGPWEFKLAYDHISSHVGDEFLESHPGFTRVNYVRDSAIIGAAYWLTRDVRVYGEVAYAFRADGGAEPWEVQFGSEYVPEIPTGRWLMPFAAAHVNLREEFDFGGSVNLMAGWRWRGTDSGRLLRFGLQYYNGKSSQYAFFDHHEELLGGGFWFDY